MAGRPFLANLRELTEYSAEEVMEYIIIILFYLPKKEAGYTFAC